MRKSKLLKFLLICSFVLMIIGIPISSYGANKENGLYINTEEVPLEIEEFAKDMFLSTNSLDIKQFNIDAPLENLTLSKGIKSISLNGDENPNYYFFVLDEDKIVAHIYASQYEDRVLGGYSSGLFETLNNVIVSPDNAITIFTSGTSLYYSNNNVLNTISDSFYANDETIENDIKTFNKNRSLYLQNQDTTPTLISQNNVYDIRLNNSIDDSRVVVGLSLDNFPCVPNKNINGGICWASATGAIIEYIENGLNSSVSGGTKIRD